METGTFKLLTLAKHSQLLVIKFTRPSAGNNHNCILAYCQVLQICNIVRFQETYKVEAMQMDISKANALQWHQTLSR